MQTHDPEFSSSTPEEAAALRELRDLVLPFFAPDTPLGRKYRFVMFTLPEDLGVMSVIHNSTPGRIADCMSHYIVACGYANVFPHFKPDGK